MEFKDLKDCIGRKICRLSPTKSGDQRFVDNDPILLVGFTLNGQIRFKYIGERSSLYRGREQTLPLEFNDSKWVLYDEWVKATETRRLLLSVGV